VRGQNVEIGDLDIFTPMLPFLVVYTWYVDDQPKSTITDFWHDEDTGMIHQEHLVVAPLTFESEASPLLARNVVSAYKSAADLASRFHTADTCQRPPLAARMLRMFRAFATSANVAAPAALIARMIGMTFAAKRSASATCASRPSAAACSGFFRLPRRTP
jgi:hypothetical protein